jgi:parallel beta-helix repeat protein
VLNDIGYTGIAFFGSNVTVENNFIRRATLFISDGGAIYSDDVGTPSAGLLIQNNVVIDSVTGQGIYLDAQSNHVNIIGNSVSGCAGAGIFLSNVNNVSVTGNTVFDCQKLLSNWNVFYPVSNAIANNNIFVARSATQILRDDWLSIEGSETVVGDNNYYARPLDDDKTFSTTINSPSFVTTLRTLAEFQLYASQEVNSHKSPKAVGSINDLRFVYNATTAPITLILSTDYIDVKGTVYPAGNLVLQPFTSKVLIKNL